MILDFTGSEAKEVFTSPPELVELLKELLQTKRWQKLEEVDAMWCYASDWQSQYLWCLVFDRACRCAFIFIFKIFQNCTVSRANSDQFSAWLPQELALQDLTYILIRFCWQRMTRKDTRVAQATMPGSSKLLFVCILKNLWIFLCLIV